MKILHLSDTHGQHKNLRSLPEADVIVHSGDFTFAGSEEEAYDFMDWFCNLPYEHKVFIAGNHDMCMYGADPIGGYWWLPLPILQNTTLIVVNQQLANSCLVTQNQRGTKTGQNHGKIKSRTLRSKYPLWNTSVSFAKVQICPLKNEGKSLFLSFTTHFPTIVPQMWLLQTVLTSNGLVCENWVLNFVLHSVGHFQKRELAIEPKICHPYCPILGFVNV